MSTILIVDDSELIRGMLAEHLSSLGYAIVTAENGLEGILHAYQKIPDLIITDVEMPRLQGYQLSRLLKSRREISKIPIIMHTSLSEDHDKFWADSSGVNAFITKDFENLDALSSCVTELLEKAEPVDRQLIAEDAAGIDESTALEMLGNLFDRELFQSTILNELSSLDRYIASLPVMVLNMLKLLNKVCETHISVLILRYEKDARVYVLPSQLTFHKDVEQFHSICLRDFEKTTGVTKGATKTEIMGIDDREDYKKMRVDGRRISSYYMAPLRGSGDEIVGTLHIGNLVNNYFSQRISANVDVFARGAGVVLENAVLFNTISEMKRKINTMFSKFVPPEVIEELLSKHEETGLKVGEKRNVAILFSDIRSFTVISENNTAEKIVSFLNEYFDRMGRIIRENGGTIDKFIGDAILAVFGAPVSYEDNAARALRSAVAMAEALQDIDLGGVVLPEIGFSTGIGIHEGTVIVGNIGSQDKFDYTVIGDNVNLASRLEGLTKHYHATIIVSDTVYNTVQDSFAFRELDTVRVKGKEQATTLYMVEIPGPGRGALEADAMGAYKKGLQMYKMGNWTTAVDYFTAILETHPEDYLCKMYIERCKEFAENPPPDDWGGAVRLEFK
jgi:adenylate cyclase